MSSGQPRRLSASEDMLWRLERGESLPFLECPRHLTLAVSLKGDLSLDALTAAIDAVIGRHEILRTRYCERDGQVIAVVGDDATTPLHRLSAGAEEDSIARCLDARCNRRFDLAGEGVIRTLLLDCGDKRHILAVTVHHIGFDGWSRHLLLQELSSAYTSHTQRQSTTALRALRSGYRDYVALQSASVNECAVSHQVATWRQQCPQTNVFGNELSTSQPPVSVVREFVISEERRQRLGRLGRDCHATLAILLAAVFAATLGDFTKQQRLLIGIPVSDRPGTDFERVIGLFMDLVLVSCDWSPSLALTDLVAQVADDFDAAYENRIPYGRLVRAVEASGVSEAPRPAVFNFMSFPSSPVLFGDLEASVMRRSGDSHACAPISLHIQDRGDTLEARWLGKSDVFSRSELESLTERFIAIVDRAIDRPATASI